ncbi:MAG: hypothetical protein LBL13_01350 [Bacteroidales bacterium]|jgi:hypothetical protein|nr:hypothetical protein [Bacteroidales bacterium]
MIKQDTLTMENSYFLTLPILFSFLSAGTVSFAQRNDDRFPLNTIPFSPNNAMTANTKQEAVHWKNELLRSHVNKYTLNNTLTDRSNYPKSSKLYRAWSGFVSCTQNKLASPHPVGTPLPVEKSVNLFVNNHRKIYEK